MHACRQGALKWPLHVLLMRVVLTTFVVGEVRTGSVHALEESDIRAAYSAEREPSNELTIIARTSKQEQAAAMRKPLAGIRLHC